MLDGVLHSTVVREFSTLPESSPGSSPGSSPESSIHARFRGELGATHYEREYGPGVHAAGLAVYTGSLYQSSRSTFRPLMRVSSGVRNLIAGGGG